VPSKEAKCVLRAVESIANKMPFPILGVDSTGLDTSFRQRIDPAACGNDTPQGLLILLAVS
jgi:hypothetical protein